MLWEGGWEWARLTKSKYISIEVTCPPPPPPPFLLLIYIYILLLPPSGGMLDPYLLLSLRGPLKICIPFGAVLKKSKKRQAKTLLLQNRSTPIALAARSAGFFSSSIFQFSIKNLSFRSWLSQKSRKTRQAETHFSKTAIWLRVSPKKSKKRQAKTRFSKKMHLAAGCP